MVKYNCGCQEVQGEERDPVGRIRDVSLLYTVSCFILKIKKHSKIVTNVHSEWWTHGLLCSCSSAFKKVFSKKKKSNISCFLNVRTSDTQWSGMVWDKSCSFRISSPHLSAKVLFSFLFPWGSLLRMRFSLTCHFGSVRHKKQLAVPKGAWKSNPILRQGSWGHRWASWEPKSSFWISCQ